MPFQEDWRESALCHSKEFRRPRTTASPEGGVVSEAATPTYVDNGCEFHTSCFSCPFSDCLFVWAEGEHNRAYGRYTHACREAREAFERGERNEDLDSVARASLKRYPKVAAEWLGPKYTMELLQGA